MLGMGAERLHSRCLAPIYRGLKVYCVDVQDGGQTSTVLGVDQKSIKKTHLLVSTVVGPL